MGGAELAIAVVILLAILTRSPGFESWSGRLCSTVRTRRAEPGSGECPDGETEIIPRFYRGVPGSNPGRGAGRSLAQASGKRSRRLAAKTSL